MPSSEPHVDPKERERRLRVLDILKSAYPGARIALRFRNPWELLVATILSAQCTDERVNRVTEHLFAKYPSVEDFARADLEELARDVRPTGFYRQKARYLQEAARMVLEEFGGQVPHTMEDLLRLPGVARKTANIVLANAFGLVEGIPVDTHVRRLAGRLGLSDGKTPERIERDLMALIPREDWATVPYVLQEHGRRICRARSPLCPQCPVRTLCPSRSS